MNCTNPTTTCYIQSRDNMAPQIELTFCAAHDPGESAAKKRLERGDATVTHENGVRVDGVSSWQHRACDHK